jgi:hypothetical protein
MWGCLTLLGDAIYDHDQICNILITLLRYWQVAENLASTYKMDSDLVFTM